MPVQIGTLRGKTDPIVERALIDLADAVNKLEAQITAMRPQRELPDRALTSAVSAVVQRVDDLNRRVLALENP